MCLALNTGSDFGAIKASEVLINFGSVSSTSNHEFMNPVHEVRASGSKAGFFRSLLDDRAMQRLAFHEKLRQIGFICLRFIHAKIFVKNMSLHFLWPSPLYLGDIPKHVAEQVDGSMVWRLSDESLSAYPEVRVGLH
jgi:hypothetical protein